MVDSGPDWLTTTAGAVHRASDIVQAQDELKVVSEVATELDRLLSQLKPVAAAARLGIGSWWSGLPIPAPLRKVLRQAENDLDRRHLTRLVPEMKSFANSAATSVRKAWGAHVDSEVGNTADLRALIDALAGGGALSVAEDLKQALGDLTVLTRQLPNALAVEQVDKMVALKEDFEAALPDSVKAFVSTAAQGGAPISLLNAEVMEWLAANNAFDNFKVVAGKPTEVPHG